MAQDKQATGFQQENLREARLYHTTRSHNEPQENAPESSINANEPVGNIGFKTVFLGTKRAPLVIREKCLTSSINDFQSFRIQMTMDIVR